MTTPQVNMNGTSKAELQREVHEAYQALNDAKRILGNMTVHGRDFQTCPDYATRFEAYRREQAARLERVEEVMQELRDLFLALHEQ